VITDIPRVMDWLAQFNLADRYPMRHLIRQTRYVGLQEYEAWLQEEMAKLLVEIEGTPWGRRPVALFPIGKAAVHAFNKHKEAKPANDSAGRVAHSLKNLERLHKGRVEVSPRVESMRAQKVRHIVFVDDFIGTGDRFIKFWNEDVHRSVKAWCSIKWCTVWVLTFAAHDTGAKRISHRIRALKYQQIRVNFRIGASPFLANPAVHDVLKRYGSKVNRSLGAFGYGNLVSPVVFQWGCPNNASELLWETGTGSKATRWRPLFPNRAVTHDCYDLFAEGSNHSLGATPEELWSAGKHRLALAMLDDLSRHKSHHQLLLVLGLKSRGRTAAQVRAVLVATDPEVAAIYDRLTESGLLSASHQLTDFGKDVLKRITKRNASKVVATPLGKNFFPSSFLGFQREA